MQVDIRNLVECYQKSCTEFAERPALGTKRGDAWFWTTYADLGGAIDRIRGGLVSLGVGPGDVVAIIAANRVEWAVACYASYGLEATFVPMYEKQRADEWKYILGDCEAKVCFTATREIFQSVLAMQPDLPALQQVIGLDLPDQDPRSFAALARAGVASPVPAHLPGASVTAGLIYTSGTTGKPKGVILSHGNLASNVVAMSQAFPLEPSDRTLSFLPWAHSFGQVAELHYLTSQGASLALNDALPNLLHNLAEVKPTVLVAVPRIFNRIYEAVHEEMHHQPKPIRKLFEDGVRNANRRSHGEPLNFFERAELTIDDKLIFKKIRDRFGGRLRFVISASAALNPEIAEFIDALGLPVYEGYGLTETSPAVTVNTPAHRKIGSVGRPLPGIRVVIDESKGEVPGQGEVIVYGPNVMRGYRGLPDETASSLTADGGLRTGDLGHLDEDGFLYITGRIKEQYKLENGKYVMPAPLEEQLKLSPYVANVMLHGINRPYNVAVVVPNVEAVKRWGQERGIQLGDVTTDPRVRELLMREIEARSAGFAGFEVPKKVLVVAEDFSMDNDLLTPTLKLKRRNAETRFAKQLDELYREPPPAARLEPVVAP